MPRGRPSDLELQVLSVLWRDGPSNVHQVLESLPDRKKRSYTTVLTVLQIMEAKGLVTHTAEGRAHVFAPRGTRRQVLGPLLRNMVQRVFGGSTLAAVQQLIEETHLSDEEMAEIQKLLATARQGQKKV